MCHFQNEFLDTTVTYVIPRRRIEGYSGAMIEVGHENCRTAKNPVVAKISLAIEPVAPVS